MNSNSETESKFSRIRRMSIRERHQRERLARREAILTAAAGVFAEHGLEGATIEMVAREAEVAVGTIYLYFCSRDDLYLSLIAERVSQIRARYLEIKARKLAPLAELRAMTAAYLDYLRGSRGLFLTQLSVAQSQLFKQLKRKAEIDHFKRVMALSREVFGLWEASVGRVYDDGLIQGALGRARTAAILWASLNGAFLLTGDAEAFREVTGLSPDNFIEETFDFQLAGAPAARSKAAARAASAHNGTAISRAAGERAPKGTKSGSRQKEQSATT
jgi:AcrR family transcriptional regulator